MYMGVLPVHMSTYHMHACLMAKEWMNFSILFQMLRTALPIPGSNLLSAEEFDFIFHSDFSFLLS